MRDGKSSPARCEASKDVTLSDLTNASGSHFVIEPGSVNLVFRTVAIHMLALERGEDGKGFERTLLGRYELERMLGAGGMGIVLLARDPSTRQQVAIKLIRPECLQEPNVIRAFLRETHHMARMEHPNVVPVREVSEQPDGPFYVMPYFAQGSLAGRIGGENPLDPDAVPRIARQIADALGYAHGRGIIHRDVKPSNILIADDGRACLADFGLARTVFNDTISGSWQSWCVGTPAYMSPAVAAGEPEDTRCDIYGFGAVLYAMLTGVAPYSGRGVKAVLDQIVVGPPMSIGKLNPAANTYLASIAEGAMARELRDRYACMADIQSDLDRVAAGQAPLGPRGNSPEGPAAAAHWSGMTAGEATVATRIDPAASRSHWIWLSAPLLVLGATALAVMMTLDPFHSRDHESFSSRPQLAGSSSQTARSPLSISALKVMIYPSPDAGDVREIGAIWLAAYSSEFARVEADLVSPAFCCLLLLHPKGTAEVCYPRGQEESGAAGQPVDALSSLSFPSSNNKYISLGEDGQGLAAFVLVAWREPLKVSPKNLRTLAEEKWSGITSAKNAASGCWEHNGAALHQSGAVRGAIVTGPDPPEALRQTCDALRDYPGVEAIRARAFPIKGDEPPGIPRAPAGRDPG